MTRKNKTKIKAFLFLAGSAAVGIASSQTVRQAAGNLLNTVRQDVKAVKDRDPAAKSTLEVCLMYSGLHAVWAYRISHELYKRGLFTPARAISQAAKALTGVEIHPGAKLGKGLFIDHGTGVVIGETAEVGDNCTLYQGVTLGGTGKDVGKRHPTLGDNVMVGAGAKILGPFKVGNNSKIAANAVVLSEVPENTTAVGMPAKIVRVGGKRISQDDMDQVHIPDPVEHELRKLTLKVEELEKKLQEIENLNGAGDDPSESNGTQRSDI